MFKKPRGHHPDPPPASPKSAEVYRRGRRYFICSWATLENDGFNILYGPVVALGLEVTSEALGGAVAAALEISRDELPPPPEGTDLSKPLTDAAGVSSYRTFAKGMTSVHIRREATIDVAPRRKASGGGSVLAADLMARLPIEATDAELGAAVVHAFALVDAD